MDERRASRTLLECIEEYLSDERSWYDPWTEDDSLILLHLQAAVEAARRKGYSETLLQDLLKGLFSHG